MSGFSQSAVLCIERSGSMHYSLHINAHTFIQDFQRSQKEMEERCDQTKVGPGTGGLYTVEMEKQSNLCEMKLPGRMQGPEGNQAGASHCVHMAP